VYALIKALTLLKYCYFFMNLKIQIELFSLEKTIIKSYSNFLIKHLTAKQINFCCLSMPSSKKRLTLQRSPHVYKKAREQFQFSMYKTVVQLDSINTQLLKFLLLAKPASLNLTIKYK